MPWPPAFTHSKIAVTPGGYHATIRGSIRLVFPHQGKWLAFRGGPDAYHFSENGVTWTATEAPKPAAVTSLRGTSSTHFTLCLSNRSPNGFSIALSVEEPSQRWKYGGEHRTNWIRRSVTTLIYSRTRTGFYMTGRAPIRSENHQFIGTEVLWKRSIRPNDISEWEPDVRYINHISYRPIEGDKRLVEENRQHGT